MSLLINRIFRGLIIIFFSVFVTSNIFATIKKQPIILVVSGWQNENIGDIAHTPGLLHLLEKNIPNARFIIWKRSKSQKVDSLLKVNFPNIKVINGKPDSNQEVIDAIQQADLFIHGSGPTIVALEHLESWISHSNKPFGFFGVTFENPTQREIAVLKKASFIFPRDTESIQHLKNAGIEGKQVMFGPDATFAFHIRNELKAREFMSQNQLEEKEFICVVTRLRKSPYWTWGNPHNFSKEEIAKRVALNESKKHEDNAKLCEAITYWVRTTKKKVVICPEMEYQVNLMDELIINQLPDDVKPYIVKHDYWLPDEAISLYSHAHSLISMECHSVIMALLVGTPAFYLRQPEDSIKGQMYYDLGLGKWVFNIEEIKGEDIIERLDEIIQNYPEAQKYAFSSIEKVNRQYKKNFKKVNALLN